jgi:hypothetical protein
MADAYADERNCENKNDFKTKIDYKYNQCFFKFLNIPPEYLFLLDEIFHHTFILTRTL